MRALAKSIMRSDNQASLEHVKFAIEEGLQTINHQRVSLILIYLTEHYRNLAEQALTLTCQRTKCLNVFGGICNGVCTENGWAFDRPSIAILFLADLSHDLLKGLYTNKSSHYKDFPQEHLTILQGKSKFDPLAQKLVVDTKKQNFQTADLDAIINQVISPGIGLSLENSFYNARAYNYGIMGLNIPIKNICSNFINAWQIIGSPQTVTAINHEKKISLDGQSLDENLMAQSKKIKHNHQINNLKKEFNISWHKASLLRLPKTQGLNTPIDYQNAIKDGNYQEIHRLYGDTLSLDLNLGDQLIWVQPDLESAQQQILKNIKQEISLDNCQFALIFTSLTLAPQFYGYDDSNLLAWRKKFPRLPLIGAYDHQVFYTPAQSRVANTYFQAAVSSLVSL